MGRPWGPIRARTPEAKALAIFLRTRIDESPLTMTAVSERVPYSKTRVGEYLSGDPVPEEDFVLLLVAVTIPEPQRCARLQAEGRRLLSEARDPKDRHTNQDGDGSLAGKLERVRAQQVETYERLTRALERQTELQETAKHSTQLVIVLLSMINTLAGRVHTLSAEREELLGQAGDRRELEDTQQRLTRALDQERRAKEELERARDKQRQAEDLAARVQQQVDELTHSLDRLRARDHGTDPSAASDGSTHTTAGSTNVVADPVADDIDQALAQAASVNDTDEQTLQRITDELQDTDSRQVVPYSPAATSGRPTVVPNNPDNPPTGKDPSAGIQAASGPPSADHPNTLTARHHHAVTLGKAGERAEAARLLDAVVQASVRVLGADHPDTLDARHSHAVTLGEAGERAEAARLLDAVVQASVRVLGADHPNTLTARHNHAANLGAAGERAEAARLFDAVVQDRVRVSGADHPHTLTARQNHAVNLGAAGERAEAARLFDALVLDRVRVLGADHPHTLDARHNHAVNLGAAGERAEAARLLDAVARDRARVLGADHPGTLTSRREQQLFEEK
ncbi:tetratricopeptide repeat protein [Kitasatospora arboriphila]|uniref:Tetratricopeptide repeat protein n=1 Tax=Kitasatospora arboriphila TaxID=258052 RepID=A0ABN1TYA6_9ACTN